MSKETLVRKFFFTAHAEKNLENKTEANGILLNV